LFNSRFMFIFAQKRKMSTITIDNSLYQGAELLAKAHNMSLQNYIESFLRRALAKEKKKDSFTLLSENELPADIRQLVGAGLPSTISDEDTNGKKAKEEYLESNRE
jgi:hypothetical protein